MEKNNLAMNRILKLVDEKSFMELGSQVTARSTDFNMDSKKAPSDGVITGYGLIDDNLVYVYSQDSSVLNGTIGEMHAKKIVHLYNMAMKMGAPIIGFLDCAGIRLQESVDALEAMGAIYAKKSEASGIIPQISAVVGSCGGGLSVLTSLSDFVFVEKKEGKRFLNSPDSIVGNNVNKCNSASAIYQAENTGNVDSIGSEDEIIAKIRQLIISLPANCDSDIYTQDCEDDLNRICENLGEGNTDVCSLIGQIADRNEFFETKELYAKEMITGFIHLNGMTIGVVANAGKECALTAEGCEKAADFVSFCDAFSIPILTIGNVSKLEASLYTEKHFGKAVARLIYAFSSATCPKVNLITGELFGTSYVVMNSKSIGADLVYAWPNAKVGMMSADLAAKIIYPNATAEELAVYSKEYERIQSGIDSAAQRGYVDLIIHPEDTRKYLIAAYEMLYTKYVKEPEKKHGTK